MNQLERDFARFNERRDIMAVVVVVAIIAGATGPLWLPALLGPVSIGTLRDGGSVFGMMLMPFAAVMVIGWLVGTVVARGRVR